MKRPKIQYIELQSIDDGIDGILTIAEKGKHLPFVPKRVYWITNLANNNAIRGMHAHKKQHQVLICIKGSFELELFDGKKRITLTLNNPAQGIYVGPMIWGTLRSFSRGCLILVLASDIYKENDYIRDFREFTRRVKPRRTAYACS